MSEVAIKALRSERGNIRRQLTNFEKSLPTYNPDKEHPALVKYARELEENRDDFNKIQGKLEALVMETYLKMVALKRREMNSRGDIFHYIIARLIFCVREIPRVHHHQSNQSILSTAGPS